MIGGWNVSSVTNMASMFSGAAAFDQPIGGWDVSSVMDMYYMFSGAASFRQDITGWFNVALRGRIRRVHGLRRSRTAPRSSSRWTIAWRRDDDACLRRRRG